MELTQQDKTPAGNRDILEDGLNVNEDESCLPLEPATGVRKSMEYLNRSRDQDESNDRTKTYDLRSNCKGNSNNKSHKKFSVVCLDYPQSAFERWCLEKTGLTRFGLIVQGLMLLLLLILIFVVILMTCLWPTSPHHQIFPVCRTSACLVASSEVITKLNSSVDPCNDIRGYTCGHWLNTHLIPSYKSEWGIKQHMQFKHREKIRELITTMPHPEDLDQIEWKIQNIYDSCMSETVETEENRPLKKVITKLGGWRVLREFSLQTWDMKKTLRELHSTYNIQPFFKIDVVPDATQPEMSIIQISPGSLGLPDKTYYYRRAEDRIVQAYKRFLMDVVMTLGATSDDASTFSDDLFGFERRLAERFPTRLPDRPGRYRPTIAKLEEIAPSVPFFDILSSLFPTARLSKKSEVVVVASDHLVNVSRIISSTDRSVLNDYMMWRLAVEYLPYLSKKYRNTVTEFHKHLYGFHEPMPRWEVCVETLQKFMGFGLEALIENSHLDSERKRKVVNEVFERIRTSMKIAIQNSNNLPPHIQEHFLDKINSLGIQIGLPIPMRHPTFYNSFYRSLSSIKDDYFNNVLYGVNFLIDEQQKRLDAPSEEHRWIDIASDGSLNIVYVPEVNKVIVPLALLAMPYFHVHYPWSVIYGGIGSEIGVAVISSITGRGLFHSGDGSLLTSDHPVCNITHECFLHHPQATPYLEATKYTFQALENVLETLPHSHQPALEYLEDQAIFFITYAQSLCSLKTPAQKDIDLTLKSHLTDISILQMLQSKSKQLSATFHCTYPLQKDSCDSLI